MDEADEKSSLLKNDPQTPSESGFSFRSVSRRQKLTLAAMAFVNFCACTCFALLAPFYPAEAKRKGASETVVGLVFGCFEFVIFLSSPFYGNFLTKIGSKFMFVCGVLTCGVCAILFGLLDKSPDGTVYIALCFASRTVEGLGASALITASFAIVAHEFPNHIATVIGALETFSGIGLMVGPPVGGALYQLGGYGLPFFVMGGLLVLCSFTAYMLMPPQAESRKPFKGSILTLFRSPLAMIVAFCSICSLATLSFMDPTLAGHLDKFKLNTVLIGLIFLLAPGIYAFTAPVWGWIGDTKGVDKSLIAVSSLFAGLSFLILGPAPFLSFIPFELYVMIISLVIFGFFVGGALIPPFKVINTAARDIGLPDSLDTYGITSGFLNSCYSLGAFIGPTVGGALTGGIGFPWAATCCAIMLFVCGFIMYGYIIWEQCSSKKVPEGYEKVDGSNTAAQAHV